MKWGLRVPDYDHSLVSLSNSILSSFGCEAFHGTLPVADDALSREPRNVVVILLDGLGVHTLERLSENCFLRGHLRQTYSSVFPPTTVAATTSLLSGLTPCEHGWLGWDMYFPGPDRIVSVFPNTLAGTRTVASKYPAAWRRFPYRSILAKIQEAGFHAYSCAAHEEPYPKGLNGALERAAGLCALDQRKLVYVYYEHPDGIEHRKGVESPECLDELVRIDRQVEAFCGQVEDASVLITADHGHLDIEPQNLSAQPQILECLERMPSMEPRACCFFVKPGWEERFEARFAEAYGDEFVLLPMERAFEEGLFGPGDRHPALAGCVGNYLAVAVGRLALFTDDEDCRNYVGHHAGMTRYELEIPLIVVDRT